MTYLWDTHAMIWAMEDDPHLPTAVRKVAQQSGEHAICGISLWEVACLADKKRIKLSIPLTDWMDKIVARIPILNITGNIAAKKLCARKISRRSGGQNHCRDRVRS